MDYCTQCGSPFHDTDKFCAACGSGKKAVQVPLVPYTTNWSLVLLFIFGQILLFAVLPLGLILVVISIVAVYYDAKKIGAGKQLNPKTGQYDKGFPPIGWALLSWVWFVFLGYLLNRKSIYEKSLAGAVVSADTNVQEKRSSVIVKEPSSPGFSPIQSLNEQSFPSSLSSDSLRSIDNAYLVREDPELEERINKDLNEIVSRGDEGINLLLGRLFRGMQLDYPTLAVRSYGELDHNEWLKRRMIVDALGDSHSDKIIAPLGSLLLATCKISQFYDILQPSIKKALMKNRNEQVDQILKMI